MMARRYGVPHVASGDLLRAHRQQGTPLGKQAQVYMEKGALVPDELVISIILERLHQPDASHGVLLDGFPRTVAQARALDNELEAAGRGLRLALYLEVPFEVLVDRAANRWTCRTCQATYNYRVNPPAQPGVCDIDQGELYQRDDDRLDIVTERIRVYIQDTVPVIEYYRERGILHEIDGTQDIPVVAAEIEREISAVLASAASP